MDDATRISVVNSKDNRRTVQLEKENLIELTKESLKEILINQIVGLLQIRFEI